MQTMYASVCFFSFKFYLFRTCIRAIWFLACWACFWKHPYLYWPGFHVAGLSHWTIVRERASQLDHLFGFAPPTTYLRAIVWGISVGAQGCWEAFTLEPEKYFYATYFELRLEYIGVPWLKSDDLNHRVRIKVLQAISNIAFRVSL